MYEYVALFWKGCHPPSDEAFITERGGLLDLGWEEVVRASWHRRPPYGGACIMRRPKDQPRMWTKGELKKLIRDERAFDVLMGDPTDDDIAAVCANTE